MNRTGRKEMPQRSEWSARFPWCLWHIFSHRWDSEFYKEANLYLFWQFYYKLCAVHFSCVNHNVKPFSGHTSRYNKRRHYQSLPLRFPSFLPWIEDWEQDSNRPVLLWGAYPLHPKRFYLNSISASYRIFHTLVYGKILLKIHNLA